MVGLSAAPISRRVWRTTVMCSSKSGCAMSTTWIRRSDSRTSSRVDLNDSTRSCGSLRMNPTVSESRNGRLPTTTFLTVVSRVANSLFSANTSDLLRRFMTVDFPTLVYPTRATWTMLPLLPRWVAFCLSIFSSFFFRRAMRSRMILRSVSISVSPGPRSPMPPRCLSRCVHMRVRRGSRYWYCASSTWVLACAVRALRAKMSRIRLFRSRILHLSSLSMLRSWDGLSSSSKITMSILCSCT